jgi:hypothetical protein
MYPEVRPQHQGDMSRGAFIILRPCSGVNWTPPRFKHKLILYGSKINMLFQSSSTTGRLGRGRDEMQLGNGHGEAKEPPHEPSPHGTRLRGSRHREERISPSKEPHDFAQKPKPVLHGRSSDLPAPLRQVSMAFRRSSLGSALPPAVDCAIPKAN